MVTIYDIAKKSGVSATTVSHALSNKRHVKKETKEKIFQVIEELGYKPNSMAQGLKTKRSNAIGMIIPSNIKHFNNNLFLMDFIPKVVDYLIIKNYYFLIFKDNHNSSVIDSYDQLIKHNRVDGFILLEPKHNDKRIEFLLAQKKPFVILGKSPEWSDAPSVDIDNIKATYRATEYLIHQGHTDIAYIGMFPDVVYAEHRLEGYKKALQKNHIPENQIYISLHPTYEKNSGYEGIKKIFNLNKSITGVVCMSDQIAIGVIEGLKDYGFKVPEDVSVIGFDDSILASYYNPPLTTIRLPIDLMANTIVQGLLDMLSNNCIFNSFQPVFETQLIERASTASRKT